MKRNPVSYRLSDDAISLIKLTAQKLGVNDTAVVELAVRRLAKEEEVKLKPVERPNS